MSTLDKNFSEKAQHLQSLYDMRLSADHEFRLAMFKILCEDFFQKYIPHESTILDLACGHGEFLNNIKAQQKIGVDINPDAKKYATSEARIIQSLSTDLSAIQDNSVDRAFTSNFFEHITREDITATLKEIYRVLKPGGKFLILQPNFRYCYKDYYMFFDHITPIDDRSLQEVLKIENFKIDFVLDKFLPYTTKSRLPNSLFLVKLYLKLPFLFRIFGKQAFIVASKAS